MGDYSSELTAGLAVLFIGLSKAGFGGGLGILTTPLCVLAFDAKSAIGILLPLLCAGDAFSLYHYWRKWDCRNLRYLLPGVCVGVLVGVGCLNRFSNRELNFLIGLLAVLFVAFHGLKERMFRHRASFQPNHAWGIPCGIGAGITSTFAHGAGPVVSMFLIPQKMPKEIYVGTSVLVFTWINWIKMPFFCLDRQWLGGSWLPEHALITLRTLEISAKYFWLVPVGVWLGVWLNRQVSERLFVRLILVFTFLMGLELMFNFARWFR
jgi:uncharacterized protein